MSQLNNGTCRCTSRSCGLKTVCARFMDKPSDVAPYADLTDECRDNHKMFIKWGK